MGDERLIVFARDPVPGHVKTRLIPALGAEGAASLYRRLTERTLGWASRLGGGKGGLVEVRFDGAPAGPLGRRFRVSPQGEGDIGARMGRAFADAFGSGGERVVIVGTDLPELTPAHVRASWRALRRADLVLGPARDGGYGLIGLRKSCPSLFEGIAWSTGAVLRQTLARARAAGLSVELLAALRDIDGPDDLPFWRRFETESISVIIPALDEEAGLPRSLDAAGSGVGVEVIVADGGSRDDTRAAAGRAGARVVLSSPGRARQMNAGAAEAAGETLVFLHADTRLPAGFAGLVRASLRDPDVVGGSFALAFEPCPPLLKINEITANWRARALRLPFGDQALFVRASVFRLLGGFREMPLMEDVEFVRRLGRAGRMAFLRPPVRTSPRRYDEGVLRRTLRNKAALLGYFLGVPPDRLARIYGRRGAGPRPI
jgi:rSAM/selenodomain-associated transferase 2/rSAM/selenodomain-associated transferase 1